MFSGFRDAKNAKHAPAASLADQRAAFWANHAEWGGKKKHIEEEATTRTLMGRLPEVPSLKWGDEEEGHGDVQSEKDVVKLLKKNCLPHEDIEQHEAEGSTKPYPELSEVEDSLMTEGMEIAKADRGKKPLPWMRKTHHSSIGG